MLVFPDQFIFFLSYLTHNSLDQFNAFIDSIAAPVFPLSPLTDTRSLRNTSVPFETLARAIQPADQPDSCAPCVQNTMQQYFEVVSQKTDTYCEMTRCPFIMEACRQRKKHPDVSDGVLLEIAKIPHFSFAFCLGRSECKVPDTPHSDSLPVVDDEVTEFLEHEEDKLICDLVEGRVCFEKAMCRAMRRGVRRVKTVCAKSKCPYIKQICQWGDVNRPWAFGMLIGKIQPWKYAMGKCE